MGLGNQHIMPIFAEDGDLYAVLLSKELWNLVEAAVRSQGRSLLEKIEPEPVEPMEDWTCFKDYWDFRYPYNAEVHCDSCGSASSDWEKDSPRKFRLKTASMGGLVGFECLSCGSRVLKRHFKDKCVFECRPLKGC